jgi:hypothetical protein
MERREMLVSGFRRLARGLPALLAAAGSLGAVLPEQAGPLAGQEPSCFPQGVTGGCEETPKPFPEEE